MSVVLNDHLKRIKKSEVRKKGKKSNAKLDLEHPEFRKSLRLLERLYRDFVQKHKTTCMVKFQFHIIGRADDSCNIETADLHEHVPFGDFAAQTVV